LPVASEDENRVRYEILDPERDWAGALLAHRGLPALPVPETGDLFFDIGRARYYSKDGKGVTGLYLVVRPGVASYSIKRLKPLCGYVRQPQQAIDPG
jgi:hypothetical protein